MAEEHIMNDQDWMEKMKQQAENPSVPDENVVR
jgi:hypothetical protein